MVSGYSLFERVKLFFQTDKREKRGLPTAAAVADWVKRHACRGNVTLHSARLWTAFRVRQTQINAALEKAGELVLLMPFITRL